MSLPVVYIAGKFRAAHQWDREENIRAAEALALEVWRRGMVALCPHTNARNFDGALPDSVWLEGDIELLRRCDALLTVDNWRDSQGARAEVRFAQVAGIPVYHTLDALTACAELAALTKADGGGGVRHG